jgi:hypothetical protein
MDSTSPGRCPGSVEHWAPGSRVEPSRNASIAEVAGKWPPAVARIGVKVLSTHEHPDLMAPDPRLAAALHLCLACFLRLPV